MTEPPEKNTSTEVKKQDQIKNQETDVNANVSQTQNSTIESSKIPNDQMVRKRLKQSYYCPYTKN